MRSKGEKVIRIIQVGLGSWGGLGQGPGETLCGAFGDGVPGRFAPPSEMLSEERLCNCPECNIIFRARKPMTFIGKQDVRDWDLGTLHRMNDLIALGLFDTGVVGSLADEERSFDLVHSVDRGAVNEELHPRFCG